MGDDEFIIAVTRSVACQNECCIVPHDEFERACAICGADRMSVECEARTPCPACEGKKP